MSELERIEKLEKEIRELKGLNKEGIATYSFSNIKFSDLEKLVDIEIKIDDNKFDTLFNNDIILDDEVIVFLKKLIKKTKPLIKYFKVDDFDKYEKTAEDCIYKLNTLEFQKDKGISFYIKALIFTLIFYNTPRKINN